MRQINLSNLKLWIKIEAALTGEPGVFEIVCQVIDQEEHFIHWASVSICTDPQLVRGNGSFANAKAVKSFEQAGGESAPGYNRHHIFDGRFPYPGKSRTLHAVKDPRYFTESGVIVAIHPVAESLAERYPFFAWYLRAQAFLKFGLDPDSVFRSNSAQSHSPAYS